MSKEIIFTKDRLPITNDFVTVIADDQELDRLSTKEAILVACSSVNLKPGPTFLPNTFSEYLSFTMAGKNDKPVDVVLVDHEFYTDYDNWKPNLDDISEIASRLGVNISSFTRSLPDFMRRPNSLSLALWLRILGYKNSIFIVSTEFIPADQIANGVLMLSNSVSDYQPAFPVDGYALKESRSGSMHFASRVKKGQFGSLEWDRKNFTGGLSDGLEQLIK